MSKNIILLFQNTIILSCSLDPDQDLQSGSKLFTCYDVCCNIRGGGLCPSCKIQRGGLCPSCKIHGGDFVHVYKNEQGVFCPGGILSYTHLDTLNIFIRMAIINSRGNRETPITAVCCEKLFNLDSFIVCI